MSADQAIALIAVIHPLSRGIRTYHQQLESSTHQQDDARTFDVVSSKRVKDRMGLGGKVPSAQSLDNLESMSTMDAMTHTTGTKRRKKEPAASYGANSESRQANPKST